MAVERRIDCSGNCLMIPWVFRLFQVVLEPLNLHLGLSLARWVDYEKRINQSEEGE